MHNLNNSSRTNWAALESRSDEDIDYSDIPPLDDEFFDHATLKIPANKARNLVHVESDIKQWFESQGDEYQDLINQVLRNYIINASET